MQKRKYPMRRTRDTYGISNLPYGSSNSARTSDLLFMAAIILSENPFQFIDENLDIENFDDPRAKDLFLALQEAQKEGILDIEGILSRCTDEAAARFVREVDTSGELQGGLEKIIKDGFEKKKKAALERKRRDLVTQLQSLSVDADPLQEKLILEEIINIDGELKATGGDINE